jgi:pimeloyl-ACP methyl ester carboxylesterase
MPDPPVLLVHGFASSWERNWRQPGWVSLLEEAGRRVIPFDLPGHGTAPKPHDPGAYADLGAALRAVLPDEPVDAIGFSLGARILLGVAADSPECFERIAVGGVGASVLEDRDGVSAELIAQAVERGSTRPGDPPVAGTFARFARADGNDPAALAALLRQPMIPLCRTDLARLNRPVLVVLGDGDDAGPADPLVAALPDARLVMLRGVDHFATRKAFGFVDAALGFIDARPR